MDYNLLINIFSLIITSISIGVAFYQIQESYKDFIFSTKLRNEALKGEWVGSYNQTNLIEGEMTFIFKKVKRIKKGEILYKPHNLANINYYQKLSFTGGFKDNRYISLTYISSDNSKIQFGNFILELSSTGKELKGKFVGFGDESNAVISGDVLLKKISPDFNQSI